ncbi:MAG: HlyD family efflux transporter periplasmic adaptor subunit [Betaproteobacteria bacterium]|nr:HlyD family efflux transporter periplasmic adaptor subunit [Betaproteobacteria bacterium]
MRFPAFREEVRAEQAHAALGTIVLIRPLSFGVLTTTAVAIAAAILSYLVLADYAKKAPLAGILVPSSGTIRVVAPQSGLVRERRVREGERVAAGEALLQLVDARVTRDDGPVGAATIVLAEQRIATTRRQRNDILAASLSEREGLRGRIAGLEAEASQLDGELEALLAREALALRSLQRHDELERRGFASPAQRQQKEEDSLEHRSRRHAAARTRMAMAREIAGLRLAVTESESRSRAQLAALDAQLAALAQEQVERRALADAVVTAPAAGTVAALLVEPGQLVASGTNLLTLLPEGSPLEAHLFAPSRAVGFIRAGQEVLLRYPAFPYQKFGIHRARVLSVSRSAIAPAELGFTPPDGSREPVYRVKVALGTQTVAAYGRAELLQAGMQVEADVLLDRRRLIEWVFEPLFSLSERS